MPAIKRYNKFATFFTFTSTVSGTSVRGTKINGSTYPNKIREEC